MELRAHRRDFFGRASIGFGEMLLLVLALSRQVRIELERHEADVDLNLPLDFAHRLGELRPADRAPRAHHVGPDIDRKFLHHPCSSHHRSMSCAMACFGGGTKLALSAPFASASATSARVNQRASSISVLSIVSSRLDA